MNLRNFLDYRESCPFCNSRLDAKFNAISGRKNDLCFDQYGEGKVTATFSMDSLNRIHKTYQIIYEFDLDNDNFAVYFADKEGHRYEDYSPTFLCERFKAFHNNLRHFEFSRSCLICNKYRFRSRSIYVSYELSSFFNPDVWYEEIAMSQKTQNGYTVYQLYNYIFDKKSNLTIWNNNDGSCSIERWPQKPTQSNFTFPLIPFVSKEKTIERLNNLLLFS